MSPRRSAPRASEVVSRHAPALFSLLDSALMRTNAIVIDELSDLEGDDVASSIFTGEEEVFAFKRCVSRLTEVRSSASSSLPTFKLRRRLNPMTLSVILGHSLRWGASAGRPLARRRRVRRTAIHEDRGLVSTFPVRVLQESDEGKGQRRETRMGSGYEEWRDEHERGRTIKRGRGEPRKSKTIKLGAK